MSTLSLHRTLPRIASVLVVAAVAVGCGGGDDNSPQVASLGSVDSAPDDTTTESSVPTDPEDAMLAFAECMRDHGIDMPDPQRVGDRGGAAIELGVDPSSEEFEAAQAACEPLMEDAFGEMEVDPEEEAEMREELLEFSACMREHGIDMPDPVFGENGRVEIRAGEDGAAGPPAEFDDEEFQAAAEECGRPGGDLFMTSDIDGRLVKVWALAGAAVVTAGAVGITSLVVAGSDDDPPATTDDTTPTGQLVEVVRRDLARIEDLDGTIGYGEATALVLVASGTLTAVPEQGAILEPGGTVAEADGAPIVAIAGAFPFWRTLGPGVSDGKDVLQLEYALALLGYAQEHDVTVDEEWTSATTDAVEAFQEDHGQDDDGTVDLGELVVLAGPVRVDDVAGVVGQAVAEAGITVTSPDRSVDVSLPTEDADLLAVGDDVEVELPTGETRPGRVDAIGAAQTDDAGASTLPVTITLDGTADGSVADGTPVEVHVSIAAAEGVLAVPVEAVLALAEGGYAVEVATAPAAGAWSGSSSASSPTGWSR